MATKKDNPEQTKGKQPSKSKTGDLEFYAYQWAIEEDPLYTIVRCFGFTQDNKNVHLIIKDLTPWCYVELPTNIEWTDSKKRLVIDKLNNIGKKDFKPMAPGGEFVKRKKLYYAWKKKREFPKKSKKEGNKDKKDEPQLTYEDELFPFIHLKFCSTAALASFCYAIKKGIEIPGLGKLDLKVHEQQLKGGADKPNTHTILKLLALKGLPAAGWIKARGIISPKEDKESSCKHEMICSFSNVNASTNTSIVHPNVGSFDIEANSTITSAMPNAASPNDKVFQISIVTSIRQKKKKYLFSLGNPSKEKVGKGVKLKTFKTEADLIVYLAEFIKKKKLNVLIGYNILGWDFEYLINRAKFTKCLSEFDVMDVMDGRHCPIVGNGFQSKAYTAQKLVYLDTLGVLLLDLLPIIKRDHKLPNYRLKTVTTNFGLPTKDPFTPQDIFKAFRQFTPDSLSAVGKYCVQDSWITLLLFEKLQIWFGLCEMAKTAHVPIFYLFTEGTQIQMLSQVMEYCMYNNYVMISNGYVSKEGEEDYMGATVLNPVPGKYKKILCFDFASLYPSIMMSHNIDYSTLVPEPEGTHIISMYDEKEYLSKWTHYPAFLKMNDEPSKTDIWQPIDNEEELEEHVNKIRKKFPGNIILIQKEKSNIPDEHCHVFSFEEHSGCLVKGTKISLGSHSENIEDLVSKNNRVMSWDEKQDGLTYSNQTNFFNQGMKECVELTLEDGTKIECTPDHRFLTSENKWVEAKDFNINEDRIKVGINPPARNWKKEMEECNGWELNIAGKIFETTTREKYDELLRFSRLLGYVITDGNVSKNRCSVFVGHMIDVNNILDDIEFLTNIRPKHSRDHSCWRIGIPLIISQYIILLDGIIIGKRVNKSAQLPKFLFQEKCPLPIIKEFLVGLFSGDGIACGYNRSNGQLTSLKFTQTKTLDNIPSLKIMLENIGLLLNKFNINSNVNKESLHEDNYEMMLYIDTCDVVKFYNTIGFYYCCHKNQRLAAAASYFKLRDNIMNQNKWVVDRCKKLKLEGLSTKKSLAQASQELIKNEGVLNSYYSIPNLNAIRQKLTPNYIIPSKRVIMFQKHFQSPKDYFLSINALQFFEDNNRKGSTSYAVNFDSNVLPTMNLKVIFRKNIGIKQTYDIEVDKTHNFIANGLITHNCEHDMTRKKLKNGTFSKAKRKIICGARYYRFIRAEFGGKGVVPILLESLIGRRKKTRGEIKVNNGILQKDFARLMKAKTSEDNIVKYIEFVSKYLEEFKIEQKEILENIDEMIEETREEILDEKECKIIIEKMSSLELLNKVLDKRQASYKICANSMYGAMGVKKGGLLPLLPGAMCVTYRGRTAIEFISKYIPEKHGGITVYGDTDSVMCFFPHITNNKDAVELAEKIITELLAYFPAPMKLEFEKIYEKYIILTKKRYMAYIANTKGEITGFTKKGVAIVRRENCKCFKSIYLQTAKALLDDHSQEDILNDIIDYINGIFQRQHSYKDFTITKTYNGNYKTKTLPAHAQLALRMKERGIPVAAGSRIEYLFTTACRGEKNFSQGEKVEELDYFARWRETLRLDYLYYIEKQFIKPLDELLFVGLGVEDFIKKQYQLRLAKFYVNEQLSELFQPIIEIDGVVEKESYTNRRRVVKSGGLEKKVVKKPVSKKTVRKSIKKIQINTYETDSEDDSPQIDVEEEDDSDSPRIVILDDEEISPDEEREMLEMVSVENIPE